MYSIYLYENGTIKPDEIVLRRWHGERMMGGNESKQGTL
jgi:hypothetical protein